MAEITKLTVDEQKLAELGYKQELHRSWSGFQNFAISFSIISILAGCFTTFGAAWNNGGPVAITLGLAHPVDLHPDHRLLHVGAGVGVSDIGGHLLVGQQARWRTRQLLHRLAEPHRPARASSRRSSTAPRSFLNITLSLFSDTYAADFLGGDYLHQQFFWFVVIMVLVTVLNLFRTSILGVINNISVWWHVIGAAIVVGILVFGPSTHQSASFVFTERFNNSGFGDGTGGVPFWFYVLPIGALLLTQYTITGFDASAHLSEETQSAADGAAKGIWRSIFYSALGGWILLLAFLFAANDPDAINEASLELRRLHRHRHLRDRTDTGDVQDHHDHLDDRPDLLLHVVPYLDVAHDVRLQPRRRGARIPAVGTRQPAPGAGQRGAGRRP